CQRRVRRHRRAVAANTDDACANQRSSRKSLIQPGACSADFQSAVSRICNPHRIGLPGSRDFNPSALGLVLCFLDMAPKRPHDMPVNCLAMVFNSESIAGGTTCDAIPSLVSMY